MSPQADEVGSMLMAIHSAQRAALRRDPSVVLCGQDLRANLYGAAEGLLEEFGETRVRDLPLSEAGTVSMAVGAAMAGLRPIIDLTIASFMYVAMDGFVNQAAKARYMFGGQTHVPAVFRASLYYHGGTGAHHADRPYPSFMNAPGLKIAVPSTPRDAKGLMTSSILDDDPVLFFEDMTLRGRRGRGPIPSDDDFVVPLGVADVKREGTDVTVVAIGGSVPLALSAAAALEGEGISVEVIDPRSLVPFDWDTVRRSVRRTGRLVAVDPAHRTCSVASEIVATIAEQEFSALRARPLRVATADVPIPSSRTLERQLYPTEQRIVAAIRQTLEED